MSDNTLCLIMTMAIGTGLLIGYVWAACKHENKCINCLINYSEAGINDGK